jgi:uncharacterized protein YyaL (SSP411 family)
MSMAAPPTLDLALESESALRLVQEKFWDAGRGVYSLNLNPDGSRQSSIAYLWDTGVVLSAYAAVAMSDPARGARLVDEWLSAHKPYWDVTGPVAGYNTNPGLSKPDRYYDDNAWVTLALVEAYEATRQVRFLDQAILVHRFVASGEDNLLGGGIHWREARDSKNTCANGNAALTALKLFAATRDASYLDQANRWLSWLDRLVDEDGLYFDHLRLDGSVERTKWSYNSALPLRAYLLRYRLLGQRADLDRAVRIARAARAHWADADTGAIRCDAAFAHHLADAWSELDCAAPRGKWSGSALRALTHAFVANRDGHGFYGNRWDSSNVSARRQLLWTASAARTLWLLRRTR